MFRPGFESLVSAPNFNKMSKEVFTNWAFRMQRDPAAACESVNVADQSLGGTSAAKTVKRAFLKAFRACTTAALRESRDEKAGLTVAVKCLRR